MENVDVARLRLDNVRFVLGFFGRVMMVVDEIGVVCWVGGADERRERGRGGDAGGGGKGGHGPEGVSGRSVERMEFAVDGGDEDDVEQLMAGFVGWGKCVAASLDEGEGFGGCGCNCCC